MIKAKYLFQLVIFVFITLNSCNNQKKYSIEEINVFLNTNIQKKDIEDYKYRNEYSINGSSYFLCNFRVKEDKFKVLMERLKRKDFIAYGDSILTLKNSVNNKELSIDMNKGKIYYTKIIE